MQKTIMFLILFAVMLMQVQSRTTYKPPQKSNLSPFHDILKILPAEKIVKIEEEHLKNDDGFKAAVLYLQGPEWRQLVNKAMQTRQYKRFTKMTDKYHLNITQAVSCIRDHIKSLKIVASTVTSKPNLGPFIADIERVLPIGEILVNVSSNPDAVQKIRKEIGTPENRKIAEALHNLPEMVKMREILKKMNFDVEPYIALVYTYLGWINWRM